MFRSRLVVVVAVAMCVPLAGQQPRWRSAWTLSHNVGLVVTGLDGTTVRTTVRPTLSGQSLRLKLSNIRANTPAEFRAAFVGVAGAGPAVVPGTNRRLSFNRASSLRLGPGESAWSDPLPFAVRAFERLSVSLEVASASDVSMHTLGLVASYRAPGRLGGDASGRAFTPLPPNAPDSTVHEFPVYWLTALDVLSPSVDRVIVAIGDSWIDGRCSTTDMGRVRSDLYERWTDVVAERLRSRRGPGAVALVNSGIAGNRIIPGGGNGPATLQRLDRDVLEQSGVTHVLFLQGMNDLGNGATAAQLTAAMQAVADRVHAKGLAIIGGTLFPLARPDRARWTRDMESQRLAVNAWIRTDARFDGVIDFDQLLSGGPPYDGSQSLKPEFGCDDNVHPNAAGYRAMGEFVDVALFDTLAK